MKNLCFVEVLVSAVLLATPEHVHSSENPAAAEEISLSPELMNLLRAEMAQLAAGVQKISIALPSAHWESLRETSANIRDSYIMKKSLTPEQAQELKQALPEQFKQLDAEFHARADKLESAALRQDPELAAFHFSRLLESCADCHSAYAKSRFPGFTDPAPATHPH